MSLSKSCSSLSNDSEWKKKKSSSRILIKLTVNDNETIRRIPIYRLFQEEDDEDSISFEKLCNYAISYSEWNETVSGEKEVRIKYIDEEGDEIEMSSDEELADAVLLLQGRAEDEEEYNYLVHKTNEVVCISLHVHATVEFHPKEEECASLKKEEEIVKQDDGEKKNEADPSLSYRRRRCQRPRRSRRCQRHPPSKPSNDADNNGNNNDNNTITTNNDHFPAPPLVEAVDAVVSYVTEKISSIKEDIKNRRDYPASMGRNHPPPLPEKDLKFDPYFIHERHTCDGCGNSPIVGYRYHATNIDDFDLCQICTEKVTCEDIQFIKAQDGLVELPKELLSNKVKDPTFVHLRHSCDVCGVSPIIGYRWHAKNIPNYDLCHECKLAYQPKDVELELVQHDPDRNFNPNVIERLSGSPTMEKSSNTENIPSTTVTKEYGTNTDATENAVAGVSLVSSTDLEVAIQRSLDTLKNEASSMEPAIVEDSSDTTSTTNTTTETAVQTTNATMETAVQTVDSSTPHDDETNVEKESNAVPSIILEDEDIALVEKKEIALLEEKDNTIDSQSSDLEKKENMEDDEKKQSKKTDVETSTIVEGDDSPEIPFDSLDKEESISSEKEGKEQEYEALDNVDEEEDWAMVEETVHEMIGSSLFRQGLEHSG